MRCVITPRGTAGTAASSALCTSRKRSSPCHTDSMAALSAVVFALSWWLGLYLLARDPRKPVLVLAAVGLTSFAAVVALDAVRIESSRRVRILEQDRDLSCRGARHRLVRGVAGAVPAVRHLAQPGRRNRPHHHGGSTGVRRCGDRRQCRRPAAAGPLADVRGDLAVVAGGDAASGVRAVAAETGGGLRRRRDAVLRARQRDPDHPAGVGAQLAGIGVDGIRRRVARRRRRDLGCVRRRPGIACRHAALVRCDRGGGRAVRRAGADRHGTDGGPDGADGAVVHQPGDRDLDQRAGRPVGRRCSTGSRSPARPTYAPTVPRCAAPRPRCPCGRSTRSTVSTTTPSPGSPVARSAITATCPSWWPAH